MHNKVKGQCEPLHVCNMCVCAYNPWFKRRLDFSLLQQGPVDLSEEGMSLDGLLAALAHHAAQTLGRVFGHKLHTHIWMRSYFV